jgi:two-component system, OmpR family, copper resistance phosphate regulon response regulator CusR
VSRILIAEDEGRIASFIDKGLRAHGFTTQTATDGQTALQLALAGNVDLLILDVGLPVMDGFAVLAELRRSRSAIPVIVLTARGGITDTVAGLEGGADDYMTKPFRFEELLARIRVRLRPDPTAPTTEIIVGDLRLDLHTRTITVTGRTVELSAREFSLAETFMQHPDQVLSREQLLSRVWGYDYDPGTNIVDVYVSNLRRKLGHEWIETRRGAGYLLRSTPSPGGRKPPGGTRD